MQFCLSSAFSAVNLLFKKSQESPMPLVRISHRAGVTDAYRQALSDGVQEAMTTARRT